LPICYCVLLLWRNAYAEALEFAQRVAAHLERETGSAGVWYEYRGSAAFLLGDYNSALDDYELALAADEGNSTIECSVYLKLSDLAFVTGDTDNERYYREQVYGRLTE